MTAVITTSLLRKLYLWRHSGELKAFKCQGFTAGAIFTCKNVSFSYKKQKTNKKTKKPKPICFFFFSFASSKTLRLWALCMAWSILLTTTTITSELNICESYTKNRLGNTLFSSEFLFWTLIYLKSPQESICAKHRFLKGQHKKRKSGCLMPWKTQLITSVSVRKLGLFVAAELHEKCDLQLYWRGIINHFFNYQYWFVSQV